MVPIGRVPSSWAGWRLAVALLSAAALWASFALPVQRLEFLLPDLAARFMPEQAPSDSVAVVTLAAAAGEAGAASTRQRLASAIDRLQAFRPKAIGLEPALDRVETPAALATVGAGLGNLKPAWRRQARLWMRQLDTDGQLARSLERAGNVVLSAPCAAGSGRTAPAAAGAFALRAAKPAGSRAAALARFLFSAPSSATPGVAWPVPVFLQHARGTGLAATCRGQRRVDSVALAVEVAGAYYPGFELALLTAAAGQPPPVVRPGRGLALGGGRFLAAPDLRYYPRPARPVPVFRLEELTRAGGAGDRLRDKVLILGAATPAPAPGLRGPGGQRFTPLTWSAQVVDSLLGGRAFLMPSWFFAAQRALVLVFTLYLLVLPAAWHRLRAPLLSALLATLALNAGLALLWLEQLWLPVVWPLLFLLGSQWLLWLAGRRHALLATLQQALVEARVALGRQLLSQGQLELALEQFAPCLPAPPAQDSMYELGLEHERRRQVHKARAIYERLAGAGYRDAAQRGRRLAELSERFPGADAAAGATLVLDRPVMELPVLGRYRLERELGRGAMGTVYLATDPTIGRQVAIKTLPLLEHYEAREQEEAAQRFLKEAEAAGRLQHPSIVGIHDAGREHDLAYITMDYVEGDSLEAWVKESALLPVWEVLDIAAQVADALAYAHGRQVVHRDIKPGNIIYDRDSGRVKITDFGVARVLDSQRTRTGTVLGTPSYMSPEQVAGRKVDGRSDLFSLGTTLFQLLTGHLPFQGDTVATLMYQIANQKTPPLRKYRRGLPVCLGRLLNRALQKAPARRFADGADMAAAIRRCRARFKGGRRRSA